MKFWKGENMERSWGDKQRESRLNVERESRVANLRKKVEIKS